MINSIGIIGAGKIARFHIEALMAAGFDINGICATPDSKRARAIAIEYKIPFFKDIPSLITNSSSQSYLVCVDAKAINEVLLQFRGIDLPLLIEKPGPSAYEKSTRSLFPDNKSWFVAYNRRFYETIDALKLSFNKDGGFLRFQFVESGSMSEIESLKETLVSNTIHGIDLINFIVGEFRLTDIQISINSDLFEAKIINKLNNYVGLLTILFGAPANTSIELINKGEIYVVKPLEILTKYDSLEIKEPTGSFKIRTYQPIWRGINNQIERCNLDFKPGFFEQSVAFKNHKSNQDTKLRTIYDNYKTIDVINIIIDSVKAL